MKGCSTISITLPIVVSLLLFLVTNIETCSASKKNPNTITNTTKFIKASCSCTTYPKLCIKSLSVYSNKIKTNYTMLTYVALSVSLTKAEKTSKTVTKIARRQDIKPSDAMAIKDCVENISDSIDELRDSLNEMNSLDQTDFDFKLSNIKTWVSAALTDDDTCMEGLGEEDVKGDARIIIRKNVVKTAQLTSNALAIVNGLKYKPKRSHH
ncbi:hypothetical protein MKW98_011738 [Papaver atlanticum]|uniref:Pectinesterase inhibitor domain-containing protein n=1 Tax=Papaver atlanticum TaxID=357466 RepID=A0AAD4S8C7_9MAGN|nr:hypothetical protein MKW98_011738 [Papaver atlanticum]